MAMKDTLTHFGVEGVPNETALRWLDWLPKGCRQAVTHTYNSGARGRAPEKITNKKNRGQAQFGLGRNPRQAAQDLRRAEVILAQFKQGDFSQADFEFVLRHYARKSEKNRQNIMAAIEDKNPFEKMVVRYGLVKTYPNKNKGKKKGGTYVSQTYISPSNLVKKATPQYRLLHGTTTRDRVAKAIAAAKKELYLELAITLGLFQ